ncbi:hypothetical protein EMIHUDRAFT_447351, partial [Emiliania huxleyi CCMP1516]|uniref:Uncharacterized protein n=2 Tax=Emiliania huxleyi TaxID=2903 RepID=A0A0D3KY01_EMIH1
LQGPRHPERVHRGDPIALAPRAQGNGGGGGGGATLLQGRGGRQRRAQETRTRGPNLPKPSATAARLSAPPPTPLPPFLAPRSTTLASTGDVGGWDQWLLRRWGGSER